MTLPFFSEDGDRDAGGDLKITISADGTPDPPGSVDYVTESVQPDGSRLRHYVCHQCLEVFDAPDDAETVHICPEGDRAGAGSGN